MSFNGFNIVDGDIYCSNSGDNANLGTDPGAPKKSLVLGIGKKTVVGAGVYTMNNTGNRSNTVVADGYVIWYSTQFRSGGSSYTGLDIRGLPGASLLAYNLGSFIDCKITDFNFSTANSSLTRCICVNSQIGFGAAADNAYDSIFIASQVQGWRFINCYFDVDSTFTWLPNLFSTFNLKNCNVQCPVNVGGNLYAVQDQFLGTPQENGYAVGIKWLTESNLIADGYSGDVVGIDAVVSTCMNRDPKFTDSARGIYVLQPDSDMIGAADDDISNISGQVVGSSVSPTDNNGVDTFVSFSPEIDLSDPTQPKLKPGETRGSIRIIKKMPGDELVNFTGVIGYAGLLQFDTSFAGGTAQNNNVPSFNPPENPNQLITTGASPDASTIISTGHGRLVGDVIRKAGEHRTISAIIDADSFTLDSPLRAIPNSLESFIADIITKVIALNPNKLDYRFRSSKKTSLPLVDLDWDNDEGASSGEAGNYYITQWFTTPTKTLDVDNSLYGNADPLRPGGIAPYTFSLRWFETEITITDEFTT